MTPRSSILLSPIALVPTPPREEHAIRYARLADALRRVRAADHVLGALHALEEPDAVLLVVYSDELRAAVREVAACGDRVATAGARAVLARWSR